MKRYTFDEFVKKYNGKRGVSCGVHYKNGTHETLFQAPLFQIIAHIQSTGNEVDYIMSK